MTTRREFLSVSIAGATGALLAPRLSSAAPKSMSVLHESSFIKSFDDFFVKQLAPAYEKQTGIKINYEPVSVGALLTRLTTVVETKSGPEISATGLNWPWLFDPSLVDVTDIATETGKNLGGWYETVTEAVVINNKWKALPWGNIGQLEVYRTDWFKQAGVNKFPDNWEDLLAAGRLLKKAGHPFGFELGHGFGDNHGWIYPLLWSYGGHEVEADGKTVSIDSSETAQALDYARKLFTDCVLQDSLGWVDVSNNKAWMAEQISCTNNAESILWFAKHNFPDIGKMTDQAQNPAGPKGRFHLLQCQSHAIFDFSPQKKEAHDFLGWMMAEKQLSGWYASADSYYAPFLHAYDDSPFWHVEPRNLPYRESLKTSHLPGWPAPIGRPQSESVAKYVVVDMFAKACTGESTKEVIADAAAQLKQIFKTA